MIKIKKSDKPKDSFHYNDSDIQAKIRDDFYHLCYVCEEYTPRHFEIDHFFPQSVYEDKTHEWNNLFFICSKCNKIKLNSYNKCVETEILNCCCDEVENLINLEFDSINDCVKITSNNQENKVIKTIELLNKIYNGINSTSNSYKYIREEIKKEIVDIDSKIEIYNQASIAEKKYADEIGKLLKKNTKSKSSNFVSFKRTYVKNETNLINVFEEYFD